MRIILIRHGQSKWQENGWMNPSEFVRWIEAYDAHGVCDEDEIPQETWQIVEEANFIITSTLPRSLHSAKRLKPSGVTEANPLFCEVEMPVPLKKASFLKLPMQVWLVFARLCWVLGYSGGVESRRQAKKRAKKAADVLNEYVQKHDNVIVVGHGWFNRLLGAELQNRGYNRKTRAGSKHWQAVTYTKE